MESAAATNHLLEVVRIDPEVAIEAAKALVKIGAQRSAISADLEVMMKSRLLGVQSRVAAAYALGYVGSSEAVAALSDVVANRSEDSNLRGHAAEALGTLRARGGVDVLVKGLQDADPTVRFWCVHALGEIRDPRSVPALHDVAARDEAEAPGLGSPAEEARRVLKSFETI
jgi:HEAT repeat protein